jgi:glycosyltransferase involved in cell wall biosynthesis
VLNDLSSLWLAPVFRAFGLRVVSLLHLYLQRRNAAGLGHGALQYRLLRLSSRFAHCVFSVNKENVDTFPVKVEFVGNFISDWFFEVPKVDDEIYDLGLIARLSPQKNVLLFVQLVEKLNQRSHRPINAVIVGKGEEELRVRHEIRRLNMQGRIEVRPWVERAELPRIFDQLRCFAITSHHEGFAMTLLEAHARGVPAISTRTAGYCAEFVEAFGEHTGLVFEREDMNSDAFFERLHNLIDNSEHYRSACIRKAKQFSEDSVLGRIREGIVALLEGSKNK